MKKVRTKKVLIGEVLKAYEGNKAFIEVFTYERLNRGFTVAMLNYLLEKGVKNG
tara:strand:+ start:370 stop:531 length:162 start_codon:yes stop_codon:yes gene_type:complete